ncbi:MAG TPA: VCBS repeat-containing protein [Planctomycetes bacterium]|nr:VCBS repeat-containing protein [Planctomycetota bacterium]
MEALIRMFAIVSVLGGALLGQWTPQVIQQFTGAAAYDHMGSSVATLNDVDGDGLPDVVVGISGDDSAAPYAGAVHVYSGATGGLIHAFTGDSVINRLGSAVAAAGDVDGDGVTDIIAGAETSSVNGAGAGAAVVYSGATGAILHTLAGQTPVGLFGHSVAGLGDLDGDGLGDFAVGAPLSNSGGGLESGTTLVYSGATGTPIFTFSGSTPLAHHGWSISNAGDVNGDGVSDLVVGIPHVANNGANSDGQVRVYSGATGGILYIFDDSAPPSLEGFSVSGAGDVNGDGFSDIIVGTPPPVNGMGIVRVYSGATGQILHVFPESSPAYLGYGHTVAGAGDVNADGFDDVVFADNSNSANGVLSGYAEVRSGKTGALLFLVRGSSYEALGSSLAAVGDLNADGASEVIIGAPGLDIFANPPPTGAARIYSLPPHLGACGEGTVGEGQGGPFDVLLVNGTAGSPSRIVDVGLDAPFTLTMLQPPANPFPAPFAIGAYIGLSDVGDVTPLPFGAGNACIPAIPGNPGYFVLTNSFIPPPNGLVSSTPTPWSWSHGGLPFPFTLTLQGVIQGTPSLVQLTNAVALRIR